MIEGGFPDISLKISDTFRQVKLERVMKKKSAKKREFNVVIEKDEDGFYVGSVPSLRGCHTQAKSLDQLMKRMTEVIALCLEEEKPTSYSNEFIGVQKIAV